MNYFYPMLFQVRRRRRTWIDQRVVDEDAPRKSRHPVSYVDQRLQDLTVRRRSHDAGNAEPRMMIHKNDDPSSISGCRLSHASQRSATIQTSLGSWFQRELIAVFRRASSRVIVQSAHGAFRDALVDDRSCSECEIPPCEGFKCLSRTDVAHR